MTVEREKVHRLVTFLGLGRFDRDRQEYVYDPTAYALGDRRAETTRFVSRALAELLTPAEIVVLATEKAASVHGSALREALPAGPATKFVTIPMGGSRGELWDQFQKIKEQLRHSSGPVMLDITHGFRSSPFFAAAVASFVRAVDKNPPDLRICYAAFEARRDGVTPIWDLSEFVSLLDWTSALVLFLRTGRSAEVAAPTMRLGRELSRSWAETKDGEPPRLEKLGKSLRDFGGNLETVRTGDLLLPGPAGSAASLASALQEARESAPVIPPLADVLDHVQREMVEPLLGASGHLAGDAGHRALAGLAGLYLEMGRWPEAAAVVREGWITRYSDPSGRAAFGARNPHNRNRPAVEAQAREAAEKRWRNREGDISKTIAGVRNDLEHAGFNWQPKPADSLQQSVRKLVEDFAALPSAPEQAEAAGRTSVFVNLSNHPSGCWSGAQRAAALRLAPEIRDLPFPAVPPEADRDEVNALADDLVTRLGTEAPGATHAMVQGEFTLAHVLVRKLQQTGIVCLAATTGREVVEQSGDTKTTRFDFVRFREYG